MRFIFRSFRFNTPFRLCMLLFLLPNACWCFCFSFYRNHLLFSFFLTQKQAAILLGEHTHNCIRNSFGFSYPIIYVAVAATAAINSLLDYIACIMYIVHRCMHTQPEVWHLDFFFSCSLTFLHEFQDNIPKNIEIYMSEQIITTTTTTIETRTIRTSREEENKTNGMIVINERMKISSEIATHSQAPNNNIFMDGKLFERGKKKTKYYMSKSSKTMYVLVNIVVIKCMKFHFDVCDHILENCMEMMVIANIIFYAIFRMKGGKRSCVHIVAHTKQNTQKQHTYHYVCNGKYFPNLDDEHAPKRCKQFWFLW